MSVLLIAYDKKKGILFEFVRQNVVIKNLNPLESRPHEADINDLLRLYELLVEISIDDSVRGMR